MGKIKVIAIIGKAGSGKDTIATALVNQYPLVFNNIISCTTRPIREGEQEGINYYYLSEEEFKQRTDMLETTNFNGWYYGTSKNNLSRDKINVGVFNPQGIRSLLLNKDIDVFIYHVRASDKTRLLRQLNRENDPDVKEIIRRFSADEKDFEELGFVPNYSLLNEKEEDIWLAIDMILANVTTLECFGQI